MKKILSVIMITIIFLIYSDYAKPQKLDQNDIPRYNIDKILPQAPNAAAFSRYGQYPVSLSSGVANIAVPLYTIKTQQLEVPISLSYHSSGIKVNDIASSVGLGWSLVAGGAISILVNGYNDFTSSGIYYDQSYPTSDDIYKDKSNTITTTLTDMSGLTNLKYDTESDIYSYNAPGLTGSSFSYNSKWNLIQFPETDNKIERIIGSGYKITGDNGIKYYFTDTGSSVLSTDASQKINSYNLTKIVSADSKDSIIFKYEKLISYVDYTPNFQARKRMSGSGKIYYPGLEKDFTKVTFSESILTKIIFKGGEVVFNIQADRKDKPNLRHSGFEVNSTSDNQCVFSCDFTHKYIESSGDKEIKNMYPEYFYRMVLDKVKIKSCISSEQEQNYYFYYNSDKLPSYDYSYFNKQDYSVISGYTYYTNYGQDRWGYYNGQANNHLIVPPINRMTQFEIEKTIGNTPNRDVSMQHAKSNILEKIVYPTGGNTIFEYESNSAHGKLIGGLRIKRISSYDNTNKFLEEKNFEYNEANEISYYSSLMDNYNYYLRAASENNEKYVDLILTSNALHGQAYSNSPVYYSKVTEYYGGLKDNYGKKEYYYKYVPNDVLEIEYYFPALVYDFGFAHSTGSISRFGHKLTFIDNTWKRGNLIEELSYQKNDIDYILRQKVVNEYKFFNEKRHIKGTVVTNFALTSAIPAGEVGKTYFTWFDTYANSGICKLTSTTTENFRNGVLEQKDIVKYNYGKLLSTKNPHTQLTRKSILTSTNDSIITVYSYPLDFDYKIQSGTDYQANQNFRKENIISTPLEIVNYKRTGNSAPLAIDGLFYKYKDVNQLQEMLKLSTVQPFAYNGATYIDNAGYNISNRYETEISYDYDFNNNIKQYVNKANVPVSILWSYNYRYPIAEVKNIYYKDLEKSLQTLGLSSESLSKSETPDMTKIKELQMKLANTGITIFEHRPMVGITELVNPQGVKLTYSYDGFNRLKDIKDSENAKLETHSYNYAGYSLSELDLTLLTSTQYTQYTKPEFNITVNNGSGNYTYNWILKDAETNSILETSNYDNFMYFFTKVGKVVLSCTVRDNTNSKQKEVIRTIEIVIPTKLEFKEILTSPNLPIYNFRQDLRCESSTTGGSGYKTYNWTLKDKSGKILATSTKDKFDVKLEKAGVINIICTVKDTYTNEQVSIEKSITVTAPPSMEWTITPSENQFGLNRTEDFKVLIKGGSGNFAYNWELKNTTTGKVLITGTDQNFPVNFSQTGKMSLTCKVKDIATDDSILPEQKILNFDVVAAPPMILKVLPEQLEYNIFDRISFTPQVKDGSGNYTYNWQLKNVTTGATSTSSKEIFEVQFTEIGTYQLSCTVKDVSKNTTKTKTYSFIVVPVAIEFKGTYYPTNTDPSQISVETYIYCSEDTEITFNLWINGHFNNGQEALFWIGNKQFTRDNSCVENAEGNKICLNSDETMILSKGNHKISIVLYNIDKSKITRAGISIKDASNGTIGQTSYLSIGND
ncbi:MAG: PKD domain-containing protein [Prevotella sp.]|jgi:hypothetical protein|nr:PKD domain-containing protein [Prevotella sp.]